MNFEKLKANLKNVFSDEKTTEDFRAELQNSPVEWFDEDGRVRCVADDTGEEFFVSPNEPLRVLSIVVQLDLHPSVAGVHVRVFAAIGGIVASKGEKHGLYTPAHCFVKMYYNANYLKVYSMDFYSSQFGRERAGNF